MLEDSAAVGHNQPFEFGREFCLYRPLGWPLFGNQTEPYFGSTRPSRVIRALKLSGRSSLIPVSQILLAIDTTYQHMALARIESGHLQKRMKTW